MKRIFQIEIKTAEEWGPGKFIAEPPDSLWAVITNPRTGAHLAVIQVDERWLAE